jgi:hypothetical protein
MARPPKPAGRPSSIRRKQKKSNPIDELQKLASAPAEIKHLKRMYREMFRTRNDRGSAILLGTYVEEALQRALELVLHVRSKQRGALFGINAPLGTFANKIRIAFALDVIGSETFGNLNLIREIRNAFAHAKIHISFKNKQVRDVCALLVMPKDLTPFPFSVTQDTPRKLFESVCYITGKSLTMRGGALSIREAPLDPSQWSLFNIAANKPFPVLPNLNVVLRQKPLP